ncbi:hypothetical protein [Peristeroidobacter agariperforans]|uniref:hypothetical protein n=1 Tax=Peristeroidobacter agariperforans TaxID=268404 RepID=UPI00101C6A00|nr:hypothetical protein [Peristeroidobacter agariperforans]
MQDRLDRYQADSRARQNPATTAALEAVIAELRISHPPGGYMQPGDAFPDFSVARMNRPAFNGDDT